MKDKTLKETEIARALREQGMPDRMEHTVLIMGSLRRRCLEEGRFLMAMLLTIDLARLCVETGRKERIEELLAEVDAMWDGRRDGAPGTGTGSSGALCPALHSFLREINGSPDDRLMAFGMAARRRPSEPASICGSRWLSYWHSQLRLQPRFSDSPA